MKSTELKSNIRFNHFVSIVLAVAVMFASPIAVMFFLLFFDYSHLNVITKIIVTSVVALSVITIPCYFICRLNYRSVWYVPIIVNIGTLMIAAGILSNYWTFNGKLLLFVSALILAIILSIWGFRRGRQINTCG